MNLSSLPVHTIPLWFLVLALFFPRLSILLAWLEHSMISFIPPVVGLVSVVLALLLPRLLILYWIYLDQGIGLWFILHLVAALMVWGGSGGYHTQRRRKAVYQ
ncbi:MAG: hypothetical protein M3O02_02665 [Acidobacteriota bacterium]|nr:hypothetical protein [Acidobacteriota bacterium]